MQRNDRLIDILALSAYSMRNRVYETVRCPSVCLSVRPSVCLFQHGPSKPAAASLLLWARRVEMPIVCCSSGVRRAGNCGQCHVVSVRT